MIEFKEKPDFGKFKPDTVTEILDILEDFGFTIASYGLAPNPNGFCYERPDRKMSTQDFIFEKYLNELLESLTSEQVLKLKREVL